ncbi:MAG: vitamin B12-dependent ribonucleotide reductase, partial [Acidobacteria bacterium]|nr:vitamin B12-dependent ribonucleotide reductase [Acidobacteriota bacterium]
KALAIYRDGSKRSQPLNTSLKEEGENGSARPARLRLPDERQAITHKFSVAGHDGYLTVGMYDDGTPGEIFVVMAKQGSVVSGLMDTVATSISMALQYGVPLKVLVDKFSHSLFEPAGFTNN